MAARSSVWLSTGVAGVTTTSPGMWVYQASSDWLCWAADERHMPIGWRTTSGTRAWPPNMKRALAAWLTSSSTAQSAKSAKRISTTGRVPIIAAPTAAPMMQASEIGVSTTRAAPNSSISPLYCPNTPPRPEVLAERPDRGIMAHFRRHRSEPGFEVALLSHDVLELGCRCPAHR